MENPIHLSAESFIEALQGKVVRDVNGKSWKFLTKGYYGVEDRIVLWNVLVSEKISIKKNYVFEYEIIILDGEFQEEFKILGGEFRRGIEIRSGLFKKAFTIHEGEFQEEFKVTTVSFESIFKVSGGRFYNSFFLSGGRFNEYISISGGKFNNIFSVQDGVYANGLMINLDVKFNGGVEIKDSLFATYFDIIEGVFQKDFKIHKSEFHGDCTIQGGSFSQKLQLSDNTFNKGISFTSTSSDLTKQTKIQELLLLNTNHLVEIKASANITHLNIQNRITSEGKININGNYFEKITFSQVINEGRIELTSVKGGSLFRIIDSNLDNAIFKGVQFDSFEDIRIQNSKLNNISTIDSHFPSQSEKVYTSIDNKGYSTRDPKKMAEIYNQLYLAMQKQGNKKEELAYYAEYLNWQKKDYYESKNYVAWLSLLLYYMSTNFGKNWVQGVGITIYLTIVFYFLFSLILSYFEGKLGWEYLNGHHISRHVRNVTIFFNPVHRLEHISDPEKPVHWFPTIIDFIGRIFIGYMIYQTVTAFRRFGRK